MEGDTVAEIILPVVDENDQEIPIELRFHPDIVATLVDVTSVAGIEQGWTYSNGTFSAPAPVDPDPVPQVVSMRQARLALLNDNLLQSVNDAIANMPGTEGDEARVEWQFSSTVERNWPLVLALAPTLNISDAQLDSLFIAAAKL